MLIQLLFLLIIASNVKSYKIGKLTFKENRTLSINNTEEIINNLDNYLSYNFQTNLSDNQTIEFLPLNYTEIYQNLLNKISKSCLLAYEVLEMLENRYNSGIISWHFRRLNEAVIKQIGIDELRQRLHLKKQKIYFNNNSIEKFEDNNNKKYLNKTLVRFEEKVNSSKGSSMVEFLFWPKDLENAEKFLDKKFPEVRQLFKLKYEEIQINTKPFNNQTIDELFKEFNGMLEKIEDSFERINFKVTFTSLFKDLYSVSCSNGTLIYDKNC
ncbi:hypothetical protein ACQ4LE_009528 [Meloidogyne hapla]